MQKFSIQEMQQQRAHLQALIDNPKVPPARKGIYQATIAKIDAELSSATQGQQKTNTVKVTRSNAKDQSPTVFKATFPYSGPSQNNQSQPKPTNIKIDFSKQAPTIDDYETEPHDELKSSVSAEVIENRRVVNIQWSNGETTPVSEGTARSKFTSALRDLANSKKAEQGRFDDLEHYMMFHRAVGYYKALTAYWNRAPTAAELEIPAMGQVKKTIFLRIQNKL